jgi:hypothetical protein
MINLFGIFKPFLDKINISMLICTFINDGWLVYGVLTPLSTIFHLYRGGRLLEYLEKTIDLSQVTDNLLSHNVVSSTPRH